ncbi:hypothetical protein Tco_0566345 [Tanacetum coccineum]
MTTLKFADTHNMVAFLSKPAESEGFEQIVDFLNAHPIKHALTVNPTIYTSCIEQFWATVKAKTINGEVQLQALVDGKKIIITESTVRRDLQLEDAEGVDCLPNATIFEQLALMGYEQVSQKLTFYKAFFSPQWKFLIHTVLQCLSPKTTAWNEFSSTMASAIICLATNQKFNFSKFIFESMVKNLDNVGKFLMYPRFVQVFLDKQLEGMSNHNRIYVTPSHTKKIFENMRMVGKGFSGRETPLFPTMVVHNQEEMVEDEAVHKERGDSLVRAATTASSLEAEQDSGNIIKTRSKATPNEAGSQGTTLGGGPRRQETMGDIIAQTRFENVSKLSNDPLLARGNTLRSGEDRLKLKEMMELCTNLQQRVLDLEKTKTTQAEEIVSLKRRVKKPEQKKRSRTQGLKRFYKVGLTARVESSRDEESLGKDASKQRRIHDIDTDEEITLVNDDNEIFDVIIMVNVIPPDHVDDVPVVEPNQHDDVPIDPEPVLDENEPKLTYPYEEVYPLNPPPPASESEPKDVIEDSNGLLSGLMRRDINSLFGRMASLSRRLCGRETVHALVDKKGKAKDEYYGKLILDLGNEVRSTVEQGMAAMEKLVEKLGNAKDKVECKKLKKELEEARIMPPKSAPLTQAAIHRMIKENVDAAIAAERARHANVRNDARGSGPARGQDVVHVLTWWNAKVATMGLETVNQMPWTEMK